MSSWRDAILKEFTPHAARLTIAADPDGLLLEERILKAIAERGFEPMTFEDHVEFRYAYESRFRSRWDRGEHADLVVGVRAPASDVRALPHDLLQGGPAGLVHPGRAVPQSELSHHRHAGAERPRRPGRRSDAEAAGPSSRRRPYRRVRPASRLRDRARDDQAGIRSVAFVAAPALPGSPHSARPRRSSPPVAEAELAVRHVAAARDLYRSRRVLRVPAGALADLPRRSNGWRNLHSRTSPARRDDSAALPGDRPGFRSGTATCASTSTTCSWRASCGR